MDILSIIGKKKQKQTLTKSEIDFFINEYTVKKSIQDYQAAALLMAINLNGLNHDEIFWLTDAMLKSGKIIDLRSCPGIKIDKHSTGGVGDKVSLILAPICVALGLKVAKLSGKGLAHTGGTIDKLESVGIEPCFNEHKYVGLLKKAGMFIVAQTEDIVPADKYLYSLRNATDTVQSFPLIAASIVSKKMALKTDYVFLDVKVGDGGFCDTIAKAVHLSTLMLDLFKKYKRKAVIHITNMNQPLGRAVGNAIEVKAAINFLKDNPECKEIKDLIYHFVSDICITTKIVKDKKTAYKRIDEVIKNGKALHAFYN
jgi:pyrimidine-nucleoside phosphorylase